MMRSIARGLTVLVASGGLALTAVTSASAAESAANDRGEVQQTVTVVGTGSAVHLSRDWVFSGSIRFRVSTTNPQTPNGGGSTVSLFRLKAGKTLAQFFSALHEEFSQNPRIAAKGTRDLDATAIARGLADVVPGHPEVVTEQLSPATYFAMDLANQGSGNPQLTRLRVVRGGHDIEQDSDLRSQVHVQAVDEHFQAPSVWPHEGTYTFENRADVLHFMDIQRVKPGTTDREIQRFFDAVLKGKHNVPPPFMPGPSGGNDVVSPGFGLQVTYDLPRGTYVLLCFVADEQTGIPHAFMGMHRVVVLR